MNLNKKSERARLPQLAPSSDPRTARLPKVPRALAERLGYDTGLLLMKTLGGTQVLVPTTARSSVISRALGEDAARVMTELFGGSDIDIPLGTRFQSIEKREAILAHAGSSKAVARALGVTRRYVDMLRADAKKSRRAALRRAFERDENRLQTQPNHPTSATGR